MPKEVIVSGPRGVSRVLRLLELFSADRKPLRLSDIQQHLDIPVSSCHVLLQEMIRLGYLRVTDDRRYEKAVRMVVLGSRIRSASDLHTAARDVLERLHATVGETIYLAMASEKEIVYVDALEATSGIISRVPIGTSRPLHGSSPGYVFLTYAVEPGRLDALLGPEPYKSNTPHTLTSRKAIMDMISETRLNGYSVALQAQNSGMFGISAPVFQSGDRLAGAVAVSAPLDRYPEGFGSLASQVTKAAAEVTTRLSANNWHQIVENFRSRPL